eukprot:gnl/MRDRNA2_/MRDRNA2_27005_c0_seq1.p1 gnl/MRDRNA2_/MRDRNA2_27005_c0~~gnl/MRDRNA2_/MRDRNA2_27005_c0_seq1.p1  ORF type:complete len:360 (-),score=64.49 gnl/MRDRNA2_/MRDRNA2_27005_c0_seq1:41-1120(-)
MRSVILIILQPLIAQCSTKELADQWADKLVDRLLASSVHSADVDGTTIAKVQPRMSLATPVRKAAQVPISQRVTGFSSPPYSASPSVGYRPQFRVDAMRSRSMQSTPGVSDMVRTAQAKMKTYGIGSSPLEKLALTAIDVANRGGARDVSAMAQAMESLDNATKAKLESATLDVKSMAGVTAPLGFFDPLGFSTLLPKGTRVDYTAEDYPSGISEGRLLFYREVELKHGRVGMLASLGILVAEKFHPLFGGNIDVPAYRAFQETPLQTFWPAVLFAIAIPETFSVFTFNSPGQGDGNEGWTVRGDRVPGDLGWDPLGLKPTDPAEFKELQTKELNNGRLAMIAAAGMLAQELATGQKIF